ncbi:MAG: hypothetical protein K8R59_18710 [Thermoanaerobaculales bacterium]|nr:hypothetical protein [Thermoanaerobaculales bacterium]
MAFAELVENIANRAGLKIIKRNPGMVTCQMGFGDGRSQQVFLHPAGDLANHPVVNISTLVRELPSSPMPSDVADGLLRANQDFKMGAFGILNEGGKRFLVFAHNMILDRLEPDEMALVIAVLAKTGDEWEAKLGGSDRF